MIKIIVNSILDYRLFQHWILNILDTPDSLESSTIDHRLVSTLFIPTYTNN